MNVLKEAREERETILEGRAQAFTIASEQKLISKINALFGRYETLKEQLNKMSAFDSNPARSISEKPLTEEAPTAGTPS